MKKGRTFNSSAGYGSPEESCGEETRCTRSLVVCRLGFRLGSMVDFRLAWVALFDVAPLIRLVLLDQIAKFAFSHELGA